MAQHYTNTEFHADQSNFPEQQAQPHPISTKAELTKSKQLPNCKLISIFFAGAVLMLIAALCLHGVTLTTTDGIMTRTDGIMTRTDEIMTRTGEIMQKLIDQDSSLNNKISEVLKTVEIKMDSVEALVEVLANATEMEKLSTDVKVSLPQKIVEMKRTMLRNSASCITLEIEDEKVFCVSSQPMLHRLADRFCQNIGAKLVSEEIRNFTLRKQIADELTTKSTHSVWIDLDDLEIEGRFIFADDVVSTNDNTEWDVGQPGGGSPENCVLLLKRTQFLVHDASCLNIIKALCVA